MFSLSARLLMLACIPIQGFSDFQILGVWVEGCRDIGEDELQSCSIRGQACKSLWAGARITGFVVSGRMVLRLEEAGVLGSTVLGLGEGVDLPVCKQSWIPG